MKEETEKLIEALEQHAKAAVSLWSSNTKETKEKLGVAIEALLDARIKACLREILSDDGK